MTVRLLGIPCASVVILLSTTPLNAQPLSGTLGVSPDRVRAGDLVTVSLTVTNRTAADAVDARCYITFPAYVVTFAGATQSSGWNFLQIGSDDLGGEVAGFRTNRLGAGASATVSIRVRLSDRAWLGAPISFRGSAYAFGSLIGFPPAGTTVAGAAPPPSAASQLFFGGAVTSPFSDIGYDPGSALFLVVGAHRRPVDPYYNAGSLLMTLINTSGEASGALVESDASLSDPRGPRVAYSPAITDGATSGGFLLTWFQQETASPWVYRIYARPIVTQGLSVGNRVTLNDDSFEEGREPAVAYSITSRLFLVTWYTCGAGTLTCRVLARRVGVDGQPVGAIIEVGDGDRPRIAWNPRTNEFGVVWANGFALVSASGEVLGRLSEFGGWFTTPPPQIAVNTETGSYVVTGDRFGGVFGMEISATGHVTSRGLISSTMSGGHAIAISYNPVSGTFLLVSAGRAVELNQYGMPLSLPIATESIFQALTSRADVAEWREIHHADGMNRTRAIGTRSPHGGSDLRLGGCATPDPFVAFGGGHCYDGGWLPPGINPDGAPLPVIEVPGGCTTPDPFLVLGGGTCSNGGWLPPGIALEPPPEPSTPVPGGCTPPDPFIVLGGGTCSNGGWLPPGITPPPPPGPGGCTTPDPFVVLGGGTCFNGGWLPPGMAVPRSSREQ